MAEENIGSTGESFDLQARALLRELQHSLYQIARRSELGTHALSSIQLDAEASLRMIDSYLLSAQAAHGQVALPLEPLSIGSVLHEVAHDARLKSICPEIVIQDRVHQPVMTHRDALRNLLLSVADSVRLISGSTHGLVLRGFKQKDGNIAVGVFAENDSLVQTDLEAVRSLQGVSHMALPRHSHTSGVSIAIADSLAQALGGSLEVKRMGRLRGFSTILPRSEQLALV